MAVEKQVNIRVTETGLDEINKDLTSLNKNINKVEGSSKGVSKGLKDVGENGGAIAVLDSLTGGLATRVRDAAEATKLFNFSLKSTRTALIATGIGAFVVALGLVVAYWDDIVEFITSANKKLQTQIDLNNKNLETLDFELKLLEEKEKILVAEGKSTTEIRKQKRAVVLLQQEENALLLENLKIQLERQKAQIKEVTLWEQIKIGASSVLGVAAKARATATATIGNEEDLTRLTEITKQIQDATLRTETLKLALLNIDKPTEGVASGVRNDKVKSVGSLKSADAVSPRVQAEFDENANILLARKQLVQDIKRTNELIAQDEFETAEKRKMQEEALAQAKVDIAQNTLSLIGAIAGEGSKVGKAVAVAQATIQGIQGVQNAYSTAQKSPVTALFPGYPIVQAGLAAAFSAVQIKKILSTDPTGRTQPNLGGAGGGAGGGVSAPSFNVVGTSGINQLAQTIQGQDEPIRAYVVGNDVTTQQAQDRNIVTTATIG